MEEKENFIYQPPFPGHSRQSHHRPLFAMNWSKVVINRPKTMFYIDETSTNCVTWLFKVKRFTSLHIYILYIYISFARFIFSIYNCFRVVWASFKAGNCGTHGSFQLDHFRGFLVTRIHRLVILHDLSGENGGQRPRLLNNTIGNRNMQTSTSLQQP